jgi:hypothetical protein
VRRTPRSAHYHRRDWTHLRRTNRGQSYSQLVRRMLALRACLVKMRVSLFDGRTWRTYLYSSLWVETLRKTEEGALQEQFADEVPVQHGIAGSEQSFKDFAIDLQLGEPRMVEQQRYQLIGYVTFRSQPDPLLEPTGDPPGFVDDLYMCGLASTILPRSVVPDL